MKHVRTAPIPDEQGFTLEKCGIVLRQYKEDSDYFTAERPGQKMILEYDLDALTHDGYESTYKATGAITGGSQIPCSYMVNAWDVYNGKPIQRKRSQPIWTPHDEWVIEEKPITEGEDPKKHKEKVIQEFERKEKECQKAEQQEHERRQKANDRNKIAEHRRDNETVIVECLSCSYMNDEQEFQCARCHRKLPCIHDELDGPEQTEVHKRSQEASSSIKTGNKPDELTSKEYTRLDQKAINLKKRIWKRREQQAETAQETPTDDHETEMDEDMTEEQEYPDWKYDSYETVDQHKASEFEFAHSQYEAENHKDNRPMQADSNTTENQEMTFEQRVEQTYTGREKLSETMKEWDEMINNNSSNEATLPRLPVQSSAATSKKNEQQTEGNAPEKKPKKSRKRTKKAKDSNQEQKRQAKKLRKRAVLFEYYGHNGQEWCKTEETAHELRQIENTDECGPIEERFWKERAFRARKMGLKPPQTAEWCRIMDVISVTAVFELKELLESTPKTITTHYVMRSAVPFEAAINTKIPMGSIKQRRQRWRENQANGIPIALHNRTQWMHNPQSTILYKMLQHSSKSDHKFTKGESQKDRVDEITESNKMKLEKDIDNKERKSFQLAIKNKHNWVNTLDDDLEGAKQSSREKALLYPQQPTQPPPKSIGAKSREQSREKYGKAPMKPKAGSDPYSHQESPPNTQSLQTNAITPMQRHNATQRAGDNVISSSSSRRSRSGHRQHDAGRAGATWRYAGYEDTAWRYSGQQEDAAEMEDAVYLQDEELP